MSNHACVTETSRQIVTTFYACIAAGNFDGVLACLHEDVEIHEPACLPYGGMYRGIEGAKRLFSEAPKHLDISIFSIDAIVADGDRVVGMLRTAIVGTGEPLAVAEESIVRDGKIIRVRVFQFDPTLVISAAASR